MSNFSETVLALRAASAELQRAHERALEAGNMDAAELIHEAGIRVAKAMGKVVIKGAVDRVAEVAS